MKALVYHGPVQKAWEGVSPRSRTGGVPTASCITSCGRRRSTSRRCRQIDASPFVTHHFVLDDFIEAYDVFGRAAETGALKVVVTRS